MPIRVKPQFAPHHQSRIWRLPAILLLPMPILMLMLWLVACDPQTSNTLPEFRGAWIREAPPGARMHAAYGTLTNPSDQTVRIDGFSSEQYQDVSLHETILQHGKSRMRPIPILVLQPRQDTILQPGGLHLMLSGPRSEIKVGAVINLSAHSTDGQVFHYQVHVERR